LEYQSPDEQGSGALCTNCAALLAGPWCSQCGQPQSSSDPTWNDLVHDTIHEFLHLDGKIFTTARRLFLEPGELTAERIRGRRVRYIGALRLYLTMSLIFFGLSAVIPNPNPDANPPVTQASSPQSDAPEQNVAKAVTSNGTGMRARIAEGTLLLATTGIVILLTFYRLGSAA
jgi:hypothetical protein